MLILDVPIAEKEYQKHSTYYKLEISLNTMVNLIWTLLLCASSKQKNQKSLLFLLFPVQISGIISRSLICSQHFILKSYLSFICFQLDFRYWGLLFGVSFLLAQLSGLYWSLSFRHNLSVMEWLISTVLGWMNLFGLSGCTGHWTFSAKFWTIRIVDHPGTEKEKAYAKVFENMRQNRKSGGALKSLCLFNCTFTCQPISDIRIACKF